MRSTLRARSVTVVLAAVSLAFQPEPLFPQAQNPKGLTREQVAAIHGRIVHSEEPGAIPDRLAKETGDIYIHAPDMIITPVFLDPKNQMANWMRRCDLVAVGKMGTGAPYMTARKGFVNTDWSFVVQEVLKNNSVEPVGAGTKVTVIAFGGQLEIGGRTVHAIQTTYREFRTGHEYLLFLKFVPETGAYASCGPTGFALFGPRMVRLRVQPIIRPEIEAMDKEAFIKALEDALN